MKEVETLDGAPREAFSAWLGQAHARLSADETLTRLEGALLVSMGGDASRPATTLSPMIRILLFTFCVIAAAIGLAWFADRPGTVTVEWLGYQVETSAFVGALARRRRGRAADPGLGGAALSAHAPRGRSRPMCASGGGSKGYDALSRGLLAIGVGDRTLAQRYAGIAGRNLPREPLTALLRAQAAQLKGDRDAARRAFEAMLDSPETQLLGLRGLFLEASRSNDNEAARALAEQAVKRDPKLAWGVNALFDMQARAGD